eukprot:TRINITY_DN18936_c0_g1_i1.p1 TRINITY_DN18936_c0_g1~~TRINITY_DN18936_c0_g1_i1.p1  ORF type:complete len:105 (-),score=18.93 TRINITY_DN18936_c0_g1_i1:196-471(-)
MTAKPNEAALRAATVMFVQRSICSRTCPWQSTSQNLFCSVLPKNRVSTWEIQVRTLRLRAKKSAVHEARGSCQHVSSIVSKTNVATKKANM